MYWPITQALLNVQARCAQKTGEGIARLHVPAHAGQSPATWGGNNARPQVIPSAIYGLDNTELDELDTLGQPKGCIAQSQKMAADLFGVEKTFYLINGASVGLMAAMLALPQAVGKTNTVLVARNCHRSVINALVLSGHQPVWIEPDFDAEFGLYQGLTLQQVQQSYALAQQAGNNLQALIITHPTYEGIESQIELIAAFCKAEGLVLIVDEAHGGLWPLSAELPVSAVSTTADCVVHSLHKSMGALTQTALLHLPKGSKIDAQKMQQALNVLQTSSPSFVLLASIESCLQFWASPEGQEYLTHYCQRIAALKAALKPLKHIKVLGNNPNIMQLVLHSNRFAAGELARVLEYDYGFACEADYGQTVLLELSPGLPAHVFEALKTALFTLDKLVLESVVYKNKITFAKALTKGSLTPREAFLMPPTVGLQQAIVAPYPPGIALEIPTLLQ